MKYPFEDKSNWDMKYPMVWRAYESRIGRVSVCLRVWHDPDTDLLKWLAWVTLTSHGHRYTAEGCCTIMREGVDMAIYAMKQLLDALRPELLGEVVETVPQRGGDAETIDHYRRAGNWLSHQWAQDVGHAVPGLEDAWKATEEQP